jgi:CubicO group peptidase (beta-lactamase class C family)
VVEAHVEHARTARRFFTLCRTPDDQPVRTLPVPYWAMPRMDEIRLPGGSTLKTQSPTDAEAFTPAAARKLAAFSRPTDTPLTPLEAAALDRQWWIGFMRRFYGIQSRPVIVQRGPLALAPTEPRHVLREGTPSEAGLSEEVIPAIEAVMTRWLTSNKGQGFAMCLARHDAVFFHRAYGRSFAGTPMTVHTPSRLTSLTKLITGLLLMTFVDQQAIDLDDDVTAILPAFRRELPPPAVPLTFRQLVTHTSGLAGHYGDELHDLAEVISDEYPYITRPVFHLYAGVGYAVAVNALETLTATPFPTLYERQLLKPLGCTDTIVPNSHEGALSTPLDLARVGVVLLHGSYGEHPFLSEANVQRMRPARLTMILGDDTQKTWGIGIWGSDASRGYSDSAFGHGGSSGASLRVDPTRDLIMSITCQEDRPYFDSSMRDEILKAIDAAVRK